jgi:hypothetical protein
VAGTRRGEAAGWGGGLATALGWARAAVRGVDRASLWLGGLRWAFMPLGLCALAAVGVHAAADRVDDPLRAALLGLDALADGLLGSLPLTEAWVDAVGERGCTRVARGVALLWELAADVVVCAPLLGYAEEGADGAEAAAGAGLRRRWGALVREALRRPTLLRLSRPLASACFALAGAVALGLTLQASLFHGLSGALGPASALALARGASLAAAGAVALSLGGRVVLRHLQRADAVAEADAGRSLAARVLHGLPGTLVLLPLAVAALVAASALEGLLG